MGYYGPGSIAGGYVMAVASAAPSSALVSGAGNAHADGAYMPRGTHNGKTYFNLEEQPDDPLLSAISWDGFQWNIYLSDGDVAYNNNGENVANPWDSAAWFEVDGEPPAPTVTEA